MTSGLDLSVVIGAGLFMAIVGMIWLWRERARPSLLDRQEATIARMLTRADSIQDDQDKLRREFDEFRRQTYEAQEAHDEEMAELRAFIDEWWRGWKLIFAQMEAAKLVPVWQPKEPPPKRKRAKVEPPAPTDQELMEAIAGQFNIEEMNTLAFEIGLSPDDFGGETRTARARELVNLARRRGLTDKLEKQRRHLRSA